MDVRQFWAAVLRQDADAIRCYFAEDACIRWPCTNERFTVEEFIRANCEYPGDWAGEVERIEDLGRTVVTVTRVYPASREGSFHAVSFFQITDGRITALDEYWADDAPAPAWRQALHLGTKIS